MLSAFAARRAQATADATQTSAEEVALAKQSTVAPTPTSLIAKRKQNPSSKSPPPSRKRKKDIKTQVQDEVMNLEEKPIHLSSSPFVPRAYSPSVAVLHESPYDLEPESEQLLSTFVPSWNQNIFPCQKENGGMAIYIILKPEETLTFIGTIYLTVLQGSISLLGSTISASPIEHPVFASKDYPTATIEALEADSAPFAPPPAKIADAVSSDHILISIQDLNSGIEGLMKLFDSHASIFTSRSDFGDWGLREFFPIQRQTPQLRTFQEPYSWKASLDIAHTYPESPRILIQGPKGSGKSMLSRMLVNRLLSRFKQVAYLDCDVGQTEFTPEGMVSLHLLTQPVFGPPFSHPRDPLRAHFVGSTSPRSSPDHFLECIIALLDAYRLDVRYSLLSEDEGESLDQIPLVINTFGWNKGIGAELISRIETSAELTHVFAFDSSTSDPIWQQEEAEPLLNVQYVTLQPVKPIRTQHYQNQADKRALMMMSYFHHSKIITATGSFERDTWNTDLPLCAMPPWEVKWSEAIDAIILVGSGSESVELLEILRVLNGAIVAMVESSRSQASESSTTGTVAYVQGRPPPSPQHSHCVGYALIRGVRASSGTLHILTPVPIERLANVRVLVMGEIQLPVIGMLDHRAESRTLGQVAGVEMANVPFLHWHSTKRDAQGAKKLRVRRNLKRKNQM
ncbi:hypothetical protein PIIN_01290 [Serendipita indica DSM 11827]|uniref:Polynucleotide 5'-hydroxyl-kinase GRC3 n=1 Tax=Serendipita indica (strain DSM 11827) TaxID=1109443 RepID=G4T834_SERID|nr:hypothetical protein PIIN_01290 [Serendipita indica DSM 11827]